MRRTTPTSVTKFVNSTLPSELNIFYLVYVLMITLKFMLTFFYHVLINLICSLILIRYNQLQRTLVLHTYVVFWMQYINS